VHCWKAGDVVVINLATATQPMEIRNVKGMRQVNVTKTFRIVAEHHSFLIKQWRKYHGDQGTK
jgi:hypothetical protein